MKVFHNEEAQRVKIFDERFYTLDGITYYPSVTTVLEAYPKGFLIQWIKEVGLQADAIRDKAGESGTYVHNQIELFLSGVGIAFEDGRFEEWLMINKFMEFYKEHVEEVISVEHKIVHTGMKIGGTMDLVCKIAGEIWLVDFKTSKSLHVTHEIQQAVYTEMWNSSCVDGLEIKRSALLWLKAKTRGIDKQGKKIQGKGWQLKEVEDIDKCMNLYAASRVIWDNENPNYAPRDKEYPAYFKLNNNGNIETEAKEKEKQEAV